MNTNILKKIFTIKKYVYTGIFIMLLFVIIDVTAVHAANKLTLNIDPNNPMPGQQVTISAVTYSFDMSHGNFKWFVDGKLFSSGVGHSKETFQAGPIGSSMHIVVKATSNRNEQFEGETTLRINDIDFIIRPMTTVPQLYRGSALASPGSTVKIYAIPHIYTSSGELNPKDLIYEWTLDDRKDFEQSGGGHNWAIVNLDSASNQEMTVSVTASTAKNTNRAFKTVTLKSYDPQVLFYPFSPLSGIGALARSIVEMNAGDSLSMLAIPYFFDKKSVETAKYTWAVNNKTIQQNPTNPLLLEIVAPADSATSISSFSFKMQDPKAIYRKAEGYLSVKVSAQ